MSKAINKKKYLDIIEKSKNIDKKVKIFKYKTENFKSKILSENESSGSIVVSIYVGNYIGK